MQLHCVSLKKSNLVTGAKVEYAHCRFCLRGFSGKAIPGQCAHLEDGKGRRNEHEKECFFHGRQKISFPEDPYIKFEVIKKQVTASFTFYADFEAISNPINSPCGEAVSRQKSTYHFLILTITCA